MKLPFLRPKGWPQKAKIVGESRYGFSEDDELIEHAIDELLEAYEAKDPARLMEALSAVIDLFRTKESHAPDALQDSESI